MKASSFVATATSGTDHLDLAALEKRGVRWCDAKGSNAKAVASYVGHGLRRLQSGAERKLLDQDSWQATVVGYGCVGREVTAMLTSLGVHTRWADPLLDEPGSLPMTPAIGARQWASVEPWLENTSLLCVHTPLTVKGPWATAGWLNEQRLAALPDNAVVICAGRGETLVGDALVKHAHRLQLVLDVWPGEPTVDSVLVGKAILATPHIAGHSGIAFE